MVQIVNTGGAVVNNYTYDEWGNITSQAEGTSNSFKYTGEMYDAETGLYYLRARYYDPGMGRFLNEDTVEGQIDNPLSLNLYTYVSNNPLIYSDPTGHRQEWGSGGGGGSAPKPTWVKAGEGVFAAVDWYTGGAISDYVNNYSGESWTAKQFLDAGGIFIQFIPISAAEATALKVGQTAEKAGVSLIQRAGQWIKVVFTGEGNFVKVNNDLIRSSATAAKKGGETVVGHALQKHAGRNPNIWGKIKGGSEQINQTALNHLNDILNAPGGFTTVTNSNGVQFLEKTLQDGRGVRLNLDGTFKGFIDH